MRILVVLLIASLVLVPGVSAETSSTETSAASDTDASLESPDPPPGNPCRPTCSTGTG